MTHTDTPTKLVTSSSSLHAVDTLTVQTSRQIAVPGDATFPEGLYATKLAVQDAAGRTVWEMTLFGSDDRAPKVVVQS